MGRPSRREALLDAALVVIRRDGAQALTLDAVAAESGTSKGGVLYHFKSKRALVDALIERWLDGLEGELEGDDVAAAYVRSCDLSGIAPEAAASEFGMLAALIAEPHVLEAVRERHAAWMDRMFAAGLNREDAWLVRLAGDGLWYSDLLGIAAPQGEDRRRVIERLLTLAQGGAR